MPRHRCTLLRRYIAKSPISQRRRAKEPPFAECAACAMAPDGQSERARMVASHFPLKTSAPDTRIRRSIMIKLTPGKLEGLKAVSDKRGVIAAAAMDQRGSLQ